MCFAFSYSAGEVVLFLSYQINRRVLATPHLEIIYSTMSVIATYEEVKDLPNQPEKYLFDVRDPPEIQETGQIPTSINIPRKCY